MYDEFQTAVYSDPDKSLEEVNRLFKDISEEYGYSYGPYEEESYFWVDVAHNFQSPMYYISYATSALSALDLWLQSLEDWDGAVDAYLELSAMGMSKPYREAVKAAGLRDIFQKGVMRQLAEGTQTGLSAYLSGADYGSQSRGIPSAGVLAAGGGAVVLIAGGALAGWRRRRTAALARAAETPWELP